MSLENVVETDVLVIGGGIAGCFAAIRAKEQVLDVTLVDKGYIGKSGATPFATTFAVFNPEWGHDLDDWMNQANLKSEYVNNREWTEIAFKDSYAIWQKVLSWGIELYKFADGTPVVWPQTPPSVKTQYPMEAFRFPNRKHAEIYRKQALKTGVKIIDRIMITDLLKYNGMVVGAIGIPMDNYDLYIFKAKATVMAAGAGAFKPNGTPLSALTHDADAMAYRAGCEITGKEWNDPHTSRGDFPAWPWSPRKDRTKSFKGDYRGLHQGLPPKFNAEGDRIGGYFGGPAFIDEAFEAHAGRAPTFWDVISATEDYHTIAAGPEGLPRKQIDLEAEQKGWVRMVLGGSLGMSTHVSDGIWPINTKCATQLPGLYAAGDSLGARSSGARYVGMGFAMASCAATGTRAGLAAAEYALQLAKHIVDQNELARSKKVVHAPVERKGGFSPRWVTQVLQNTMMPYWILYIKHADRLQATLTQIKFMRDHIVPKLMANDAHELRLAHETKNMVLNAEMKLRASLFRTESRGTHYREDYPRRDDPTWLAWIKIKDEAGKMKLLKEPIPKKWWPDLSLPYEERYPARLPGE